MWGKNMKNEKNCFKKMPVPVLTRDAPDTVFAGYPANPKARYQISGQGRIPGT
jgi:hypothetical protein